MVIVVFIIIVGITLILCLTCIRGNRNASQLARGNLLIFKKRHEGGTAELHGYRPQKKVTFTCIGSLRLQTLRPHVSVINSAFPMPTPDRLATLLQTQAISCALFAERDKVISPESEFHIYIMKPSDPSFPHSSCRECFLGVGGREE